MDSQNSRLRIHFVDSSDDGASHDAAFALRSPNEEGEALPEDANSENASNNARLTAGTEGRYPYGAPRAITSGNHHAGNVATSSSSGAARQGSGSGWLMSALLRGANATAALFLGQNADSHEPYDIDDEIAEARAGPSSSTGRDRSANRGRGEDVRSVSSGGWEFGSAQRHGSSSTSTETPTMRAFSDTMAADDTDYDQVSLDLHDTVLLYLQTGSNVFMNIILATLKSSNVLVNGETFEMSSGNPNLVKIFLDSGHVDVEDPHVQEVVQAKVNEVLAGDPYDGSIVPGELLDYMRSLCSVPSIRITFTQMLLIRYSGFDFIELLIDHPYLIEKVKKPRLCVRIVLNVLYYIGIGMSWFGVLVNMMFMAMVLWTIVFWFQHAENRNNGYWTIIAYVGGYVVSLVATIRAEEGKITHYDNQIWQYPHNNLRIVPIYPHYEVMLSYISLRYELLDDAKRFYIIRCDLRNGILLQQINNGYYLALPQLILQTFLFTDQFRNTAYLGAVVYWLLLGSSCALMLMSIFGYYGIAVFSHSRNDQGFAILSIQGNNAKTKEVVKALSRRVRVSGIARKVLVFFTFYYVISESVTVFISLLNLSQCSGGAVVFISIWVAVLGCTVIFLVLYQLYLPASRFIGFAVLPTLVMQIAYFIYMHYELNKTTCVIFAFGYSGWLIPSLACFGLLCLSIIGYVVVLLVELIRGQAITQHVLDHLLCT